MTNHELFNLELLQESENVQCDIYDGEKALAKAIELGHPDASIIAQAIQVGDNEFNTTTIFHKGRYIGRWGRVVEQIYLQLNKQGNEWEWINDSQPCLLNKTRNIQIICMSGNPALGITDQIISAQCGKGYQTKVKILQNQPAYDDSTKMKTWILYFPSRSNAMYQDDIAILKFELTYPTSFVILPTKRNQKIEILPSNHTCRLIFEINGNDGLTPTKYKLPSDGQETSEIRPDDFNIQLAV